MRAPSSVAAASWLSASKATQTATAAAVRRFLSIAIFIPVISRLELPSLAIGSSVKSVAGLHYLGARPSGYSPAITISIGLKWFLGLAINAKALAECAKVLFGRLQRPDQQDHGYGGDHHQDLEGQPHAPVVAKAVASGAHNQRVVLVADRGEECAGGRYRYRH